VKIFTEEHICTFIFELCGGTMCQNAPLMVNSWILGFN